jgi:hypothetical protein
MQTECLPMIQTKQKEVSRELVVEHLSVVLGEEKFLNIVKDNEGVMELPVNNYLKTPGEIELEFKYGISPRKGHLRRDSLDDVVTITKTDGYLNIHNLDEALSGFMEENY